MKLESAPRAPTHFELQGNARYFPPRNLHKDWLDYMPVFSP